MESKILTGLKVEALAVDVQENAEITIRRSALGYVEWLVIGENQIDLPEGSWSILGRADEFTMSTISQMLPENINNENIQAYGWDEWQSYCTANNLTNQLILIKNG